MKFLSVLLSTSIGSLMLLLLPSCVAPGYGYSDNGYATSTAYSGASIRVLPTGYQRIYHGGIPYYYTGNYWYKRSHNGYIRSNRPHGYTGSIGRVIHNNNIRSNYSRPSLSKYKVPYANSRYVSSLSNRSRYNTHQSINRPKAAVKKQVRQTVSTQRVSTNKVSKKTFQNNAQKAQTQAQRASQSANTARSFSTSR